ncbi:MAG: hypothetical protein L3K19_00270 [Thermoplasmata archaeon]|nr:hypothetical protein [Thermoplasmata archaeon]
MTLSGGVVPIGGAMTNITDANGHYAFAFSCSTGSAIVTVTARAMGYVTFTTGNAALSPHQTTWLNASINLTKTNDFGLYNSPGGDSDYNLSYPGDLGSTWTVSDSSEISYQTTGVSASLVTTGIPSGLPSGDSTVLKFTGTDGSSTSYPLAVSYVGLGTPPAPNIGITGTALFPALSSPVFLEFYVYVPTSSASANFSVDALLSDGNFLSGETQKFTNQVGPLDGKGEQCAAPTISIPRGNWVQVVCDLSLTQNLYISQFMVDYVNGWNKATPGTFVAYFDSIRLVNAPYAKDITNGNFEDAKLYGWVTQGSPTISTSTVFAGNQSMQMQLNPGTCGNDHGCSYTEQAWQQFRVPNNIDNSGPVNFAMNLVGEVNFGISCSSPNCPTYQAANVTILDQTYDYYETNTNFTSATAGWSQVSMNITRFEGHVIELHIGVTALGSSSHTIGTVNAYFDDFKVLPKGSFMEENGSTAHRLYTGQLNLPTATYNPSCNSGGNSNTYVFAAPYEAAANNSWKINDWSSGGPTYMTSNLTLAVDFQQLNHVCGNVEDTLDLSITAMANATGPITPPSGATVTGTSYGEADVATLCMGVKETKLSGNSIYGSWPGFDSAATQNTLGLGSSSPATAQLVSQEFTAQDFAVSAAEEITIMAIEVGLGIETFGLTIVMEAVAGLALELAVGLLENLFGTSSLGGSTSICTMSGSNLWTEVLSGGTVAGGNLSHSSVAEASVSRLQLFAGCLDGGSGTCSSGGPYGGVYLVTFVTQAVLCVWQVNQTGGCSGPNGNPYATETATISLVLRV